MSERLTEAPASAADLEWSADPGVHRSPEGATPGSPAQQSTAGQSTPDLAKDRAGDVKDTAAEAGGHVADVAKEQVQQVAGDAGRTAKDLLEQSRGELEQQAGVQQERVASGLHALGSELRSLADGSQESGVVVDVAREAAARTEAVATWLEHRQPGDVLAEIRQFARQRPGTFLALAAGAGVVTARLARGIQAGPPAESPSSPLEQNEFGAAEDRPAARPFAP